MSITGTTEGSGIRNNSNKLTLALVVWCWESWKGNILEARIYIREVCHGHASRVTIFSFNISKKVVVAHKLDIKDRPIKLRFRKPYSYYYILLYNELDNSLHFDPVYSSFIVEIGCYIYNLWGFAEIKAKYPLLPRYLVRWQTLLTDWTLASPLGWKLATPTKNSRLKLVFSGDERHFKNIQNMNKFDSFLNLFLQT